MQTITSTIQDSFWTPRQRLICEEIIPYQYEVLNDAIPGITPSHSIENFRIAAGESTGKFHGEKFQDSDVYKWLEAASYSQKIYPSATLEQKMDSLISLIGRAQQPDGYLNTYYTCAEPQARLQDITYGHELYSAGHLIEAAVAHRESTGKTTLLTITTRFVEYLLATIGPKPGQLAIYPGHPEIELALMRLYRLTNDVRYRDFADWMITERGKQPSFLLKDPNGNKIPHDQWFALGYHQAHEPALQQTQAVGHAVRALYLYCAMTDLATQDATRADQMQQLWQDITRKKMYITGAVGGEAHGESFSNPYDLPNDRAYNETCASISMVLWGHRMAALRQDANYADSMERALYNGTLSGISLDGKRYFYVNPLKVEPALTASRFDQKHVEPQRVGWYGCACCPPNIARLISSLDQYIYTCKPGSIAVDMYIGNQTSFIQDGNEIALHIESDYLHTGTITATISAPKATDFTLHFRIPEWCTSPVILLNGEAQHLEAQNGYVQFARSWQRETTITLHFNPEVRQFYANPLVHEDAGRTAFMRGPLVFCFEQADNGSGLEELRVPHHDFIATWDETFAGGVPVLHGSGLRQKRDGWQDTLYATTPPQWQTQPLRAVPYFSWGNRTPGEMAVWMQE